MAVSNHQAENDKKAQKTVFDIHYAINKRGRDWRNWHCRLGVWGGGGGTAGQTLKGGQALKQRLMFLCWFEVAA